MTSQPLNKNDHGLFSVAPMMDWTDRHCRYFHRLLSPHARLYTEMLTTGALIYGDAPRFLRFHDSEHPVALQLGGSDPDALAISARKGQMAGYDEINLNCGCPSDRVQSGCFGAVLMKSPALVADCVQAMRREVDIPVTVKCRIAIDEEEEEPFLDRFIETVAATGCRTFIIHARKAWLKGLSPKENRDIPPLNYDLVSRMKEKNPQLEIILNGGVQTLAHVENELRRFDGVMIGRAAYQNPWILREIEQTLFGPQDLPDARDVIARMAEYATAEYERYGTPVKSVARHMIGLFQGVPGAKAWRQALSPLRPENFGMSDPGDGRVLLRIYDSVFGSEGLNPASINRRIAC